MAISLALTFPTAKGTQEIKKIKGKRREEFAISVSMREHLLIIVLSP